MKAKHVEQKIDTMGTLNWTEVVLTPAEKRLLAEHNNDLIKSGLVADWINAQPLEPELFSSRVARLKDEYADLLVQGELPDPRRKVVVSGDDWRYADDAMTLDDLREGEALTWGETQCRKLTNNTPLSRQWFFVKIYDTCVHFLAETDAERKLDLAARIGDLLATLELRHQHLGNATRGEDVLNGARDAAQQRNLKHMPIREARFARMRNLVHKIGVENAARQCEAEGLGGWQAIKKQWNRHN